MKLPAGPCATTAAIAAGATLAAMVLAAPAAADPAAIVNQIADEGQAQIAYGAGLISQGDAVNGLSYVIQGEDNVLIASPQDALLAQLESPDQMFYYTYFGSGDAPFPMPTDVGQLTADLQNIYSEGQSLFTSGAIAFALGAANLGLAETFQGINDLTVVLPEEALLGPLSISANTAELYDAVAVYEQQYIESVFQIATNNSAPPPIPSLPPVDFGLQQDLAKLGADLVALKDELNTTDIFPGIPITDQAALDYLPGGFEVHALEGLSLSGTLLDPSISLTDKIIEGVSFLQSIFAP